MGCTCGLILVGRNHWPLAGAIFVIGTIGYYGAFYRLQFPLTVRQPAEKSPFRFRTGFCHGVSGGCDSFRDEHRGG